MTWDSGFNVKIYVNGILSGSGTSANPQDFLDEVHFAHYGNFRASFFNGLIDEIGIYNRVLAESEVQLIVNARDAGKCKGVPFAFVPNVGSGTVSVIDLRTNTVKSTLTIPGIGGGIAVDPAGDRVYLAGNGLNNSIWIIDPTTLHVAEKQLDRMTTGVAANPQGTRLYVTHTHVDASVHESVNDGSLSVIDTTLPDYPVVANVPLPGLIPVGVAVSPKGDRVYVTYSSCCSGLLSVIDASTNQHITRVDTGGDKALGLAVSPDGTRVYVAHFQGGPLGVINATTNSLLTTINMPRQGHVAVTPDGSRIYVTNQDINEVSVVDAASNQLVDNVQVGTEPAGLGITPDGLYAYVVNRNLGNQGSISIIETTGNTVVGTLPMQNGPRPLGKFIALLEAQPNTAVNQVPVAACKNVTVNTGPGTCSAAASVNNGSFDPDGTISTLTQAPLGPYGKGATDVTLTVTDNDGASSSCSATVLVVDSQPPAIVCPVGLGVEATQPGGAIASFASPSVSDNCGAAVVVDCTPGSGSLFPLGPTSVSCSATDAPGNSNSCAFPITVRDTTPPSLTEAPNLVIELTSPGGAVVNYVLPIASDAVSTPVVTCNPPPGSLFSMGDTTVICTAKDAANNSSNAASFTVTVQDTTAPVVALSSPGIDSVITASPAMVTLQASDAAGVGRIHVNGITASLIAGTPQSGTWQASVPLPLPVDFGGQLFFNIGAVDFTGNSASAQKIVDNDGIASIVDPEPNHFSVRFSYGGTSGHVHRGPWLLVVTPQIYASHPDKGVEIVARGTNNIPPAEIHNCPDTGAEVTRMDRDGEKVSIRCLDNAAGPNHRTEVTAVQAIPTIEVGKTHVYGSCPGCYYQVTFYLATGQIGTIGSPVTASAENAEPFLVELQDSKNVAFGSFQLMPSGSVDVNFPSPGSVEVSVLSGAITATIEGQTTALTAGQVKTQALPTTVTKNLSGQISDYLASGEIKNGGIAQSLLASLNNANRLIKINTTAAREILGAFLQKLDAFSSGDQITAVVRDTLGFQAAALLSALP